MQEPEAWFMQHLDLYPEEQVELASLKGHRRLEWLASRHLLHTLYKGLDRVPCIKDQYGKPYLAGMTDHISFSHSRDLVAAIYSPHAVGIDVQYVVPRITALRPKFVSSQEANLTQMLTMCIICTWSGALKKVCTKHMADGNLIFANNFKYSGAATRKASRVPSAGICSGRL